MTSTSTTLASNAQIVPQVTHSYSTLFYSLVNVEERFARGGAGSMENGLGKLPNY